MRVKPLSYSSSWFLELSTSIKLGSCIVISNLRIFCWIIRKASRLLTSGWVTLIKRVSCWRPPAARLVMLRLKWSKENGTRVWESISGRVGWSFLLCYAATYLSKTLTLRLSTRRFCQDSTPCTNRFPKMQETSSQGYLTRIKTNATPFLKSVHTNGFQNQKVLNSNIIKII